MFMLQTYHTCLVMLFIHSIGNMEKDYEVALSAVFIYVTRRDIKNVFLSKWSDTIE